MDLDTERLDQAALALLRLGLHEGARAWKSFDWDVMARLHEKGFISDPHGKTKSVVFTERGLAEADAYWEIYSASGPRVGQAARRLSHHDDSNDRFEAAQPRCLVTAQGRQRVLQPPRVLPAGSDSAAAGRVRDRSLVEDVVDVQTQDTMVLARSW